MVFKHGEMQVSILTDVAVRWVTAFAVLVLQFGSPHYSRTMKARRHTKAPLPTKEGWRPLRPTGWFSRPRSFGIVNGWQDSNWDISIRDHQRPLCSLGQNRDQMCNGLIAVSVSSGEHSGPVCDGACPLAATGTTHLNSRSLVRMRPSAVSVRDGLTRHRPAAFVSDRPVSANSPATDASQFSGLNRPATAL
jgi:hypothetical protein